MSDTGRSNRPPLLPVAIVTCALAAGAFGQERAPATAPAPAETPAARPPDERDRRLVTNVFYETSLRQALSDIATQVGVVIVPDISVRGVVTADLRAVPLERALQIVLAGTGFVVKKMPDYYLVCSPALDSPSFPLVSETKVVRVNYLKAETAAKLLSTSFQPFVQADPKGEAVSVTAPPELLERIVADLALIDRPPGHVLLEARIVVIEQSDLLDLGIQWNWPQVRMGTFSDSAHHGGGTETPAWPWGIQIGYTPSREFTNSLLLTLNLLSQNDQATVIARPQLMAQHGREAEIKVNTEEYFEITSESIYTTARLEKVETGTILGITPQVGEDGAITLTIATEVSGVIARGEKNLPVVTRRTAKSTVRVEGGGTAVLAGLMDSRSEKNRSGVPGLSELPLLGPLFRRDTNRNASRQVAVFITATLVRPEAGGGEDQPAEGPVIPPVPDKEFREALRESLRRLGHGILKQ